jgi:hypothetical protein
VCNDRAILRGLARQVRDIADSPVMVKLRYKWREHNALRGKRPMIYVLPEGAWPELIPESALQCVDAFHRGLERDLRMKIYSHCVLRDDTPLDPWFNVVWRISIGDYGVKIPFTHGDQRGSFVWEPPIKDLSRDMDKVHPREFKVNREESAKIFNRIGDLFGDVLPPRMSGSFWWTLGLTQDAAYLIGLENLMIAMYDQPDELHRLMAFLRDDAMRMITWAESEGLITTNTTDGDMIGSGGYGAIEGISHSSIDEPAQLSDRWGFAESQETVGISPAMFHDFILPYQIPLLEKFGLNYYGCCEGLEHRIDSVLNYIPRLRRVSVAPNAKQEILAEKLAGNYVFCRKPYPAHVCVGFNEPAIRQDIRHTLRLAGDQPLEFVLKDTHTVENEPWRMKRWVEIARDEIDRQFSMDRLSC